MTNSIASRAGSGRRSILGQIAMPFRFVGNGLMAIASHRAEAKMRQVHDLSNLTDAELAHRGLRRDDIYRHVFRGTAWM